MAFDEKSIPSQFRKDEVKPFIIPGGQTLVYATCNRLLNDVSKHVCKVNSILSLKALLRMTARQVTGSIGIIPWFVDKGTIRFILNLSNRKLLAYFGGGLKFKYKPLEGLLHELNDEVPQWSSYFMEKLLGDQTQEESKPFIILQDQYFPNNQGKTESTARCHFVILLRVDPEIQSNFVKTNEITKLLVYSMDDIIHHKAPRGINAIYASNPRNNGMRVFNDWLTNPHLRDILNDYFDRSYGMTLEKRISQNVNREENEKEEYNRLIPSARRSSKRSHRTRIASTKKNHSSSPRRFHQKRI